MTSGRGAAAKERDHDDAEYIFLEEQYDRVHNIVAHFKQIWSDLQNGVDGNARDDDDFKRDYDNRLDDDYKRDDEYGRHDELKVNISRFTDERSVASSDVGGPSKFVIETSFDEEQEVGTSATTLFDALFDKLAENEDIGDEPMEKLSMYLQQNGYDSDSIEFDANLLENSNIFGVFQQKGMRGSIDVVISRFLRGIKCMYKPTCNLHVF